MIKPILAGGLAVLVGMAIGLLWAAHHQTVQSHGFDCDWCATACKADGGVR